MSHRHPRRWLANRFCVTAVLLAGACTAFQPITAPRGATGREVEIRFAGARNLDAMTSSGSLVLLEDVQRVRGRIVAVHADTVLVAVSAWAAGGGGRWRTEQTPPIAALALPDREITIGHRRLSNATAFAVVATPFVILFLLLYVATYATEST